MAGRDERGAERAPRMRLSSEKRERFLEVLGQTGNRRAAAEAIGVEPRLMDQRRRFDKLLDRQWREALEQSQRRLEGTEGPFDCIGGGGMNVIRRDGDGRTKIVRAGPKRWTKAVEESFLAALGACGNVAAAARSVGFSESSVWRRRRQWTAFADAMERVLEEAEIRIEFRLATLSNDLAVGLETNEERFPGVDSDGGAKAAPSAVPFDPEFALRFLKWREEKRRGRGRNGPPQWEREMPIEEVRDTVLKRLAAIRRHREREQLEDGWAKDENGYMIPPGWTRAQPPECGGAAEASTRAAHLLKATPGVR